VPTTKNVYLLHRQAQATTMSSIEPLTIAQGAINHSPMEWWAKQDAVTIKTMELARYCGEFSTQAKTAAIIGLLLTILALFYFGRWREPIVRRLGDQVVTVDKALLFSIAVCFAVVITRLFYGG